MRAWWYVTCLKDDDTVMHIAEDRERAITDACEMLERGIDVTELGPMVETTMDRISAAKIREILGRRRAA
jgi:hypothetical protein